MSPAAGVSPLAAAAWPFTERAILEVCFGVANALECMHQANMAHNDIKPHNSNQQRQFTYCIDIITTSLAVVCFCVCAVLLDDSFKPVLMDLGSAGPAKIPVRSRSTALEVPPTRHNQRTC